MRDHIRMQNRKRENLAVIMIFIITVIHNQVAFRGGECMRQSQNQDGDNDTLCGLSFPAEQGKGRSKHVANKDKSRQMGRGK